MEEVFK